MGKNTTLHHSKNYYFNFYNWGYYYISAGTLSYKKIVEKFNGESTTSIMA